jgi:predicted nucleotidyltransferase/HEPN domain-containing protein
MNQTPTITAVSQLPQEKQDELAHISAIIQRECNDAYIIILFGSYARGDWKEGPHEQGRGKLLIHKKSDYDILVVTRLEYAAKDITLWKTIEKACAAKGVKPYVRIIPRDINFINDQLYQGQYFFTEIINDGIVLFDNGKVELEEERKPLDPVEAKRIAQADFDEVFKSAKGFYKGYTFYLSEEDYKLAAFSLNQACEHAYKTVLLVFASECPQEHHLDILGNLDADYCPELKNIFPQQTEDQKQVFELLDYDYIGARYDRHYIITREQLALLAPCVEELHRVVEKCCLEKIRCFVPFVSDSTYTE